MNFKEDIAKIGEFDICQLRDKVESLAEKAWIEDLSRQKEFEAHTDTQTIKLLFDPDYRHRGPTSHPPLAEFQPIIDPFMRHIREYYAKTLRQRKTIARNGPGYFIRIILTRLAAQSRITPHADNGLSLKLCHRIHLPIFTNETCIFRVGATAINMRAGEMWEINNRRIHAVENDGDAPRVHLIMDYVQPGEKVFDMEGPLTA